MVQSPAPTYLAFAPRHVSHCTSTILIKPFTLKWMQAQDTYHPYYMDKDASLSVSYVCDL